MAKIDAFFKLMYDTGASDLHLIAGMGLRVLPCLTGLKQGPQGRNRGGALAGILHQVRFFQRKKKVFRMLLHQRVHDIDGILKPLFAAQEKRERHASVGARLTAGFARFIQIFETLVLVSVNAGNADGNFDRQRQAADHKVVRPDDGFGVHKAGLQLEHLLMVATRRKRVSHGRKP